jgi:iron complex outermembrane receptor protein
MRTLLTPLSAAVLTALAGTAPVARAQSEPPAPPTRPAAEAPPATTLERVEIRRTGPSDTALRQQSTAAKTIVGREEIERMGDGSVGEILQRLPGVVVGGRPGRSSSVRLRGMGAGYTQILVNGERLAAGMTLESISPEQIERIEITRGPTAETGAQAVAGTINIILRDGTDTRQRLNTVHLRWSHDDRDDLGASWNRSAQIDDFSYTLSAHAYRNRSLDEVVQHTVETDLASGAPTLDQTRRTRTETRRDAVHLGGRLQWRLGPGESFALMPFVMQTRAHTGVEQTLDTPVGQGDFARAAQDGSSRFSLARLNAQWQTRLAPGTRLELKGGASTSRSTGQSLRDEYGLPVPVATGGSTDPLLRQLDDDRSGRDDWLSTSGKVTQSLGEGRHQVAFGWELERGRRDDERTLLQTASGTTTTLGGDLGDDLNVRTLRRALWLQDEWAVTPQWAVQPGLRWEAITTRSDRTDAPVDHRSSVVTPLLHAVWRPEEGGRDQVRFALTRSWRAPTLAQLVGRRTESVGSNLATNPDRAGNPDLRPELATGLDIAYEHYLPAGGLVSVGVFERRIDQLIRTRTTQETLDGVTRWVARPQNVGEARTRGLEVEARGRLAEWLDRPEAPRVELRGNISVFHSRVDGVSGPDNRIDQQPDWSGSLGADWRVRDWPLTLGASVTYTPAYAVQVDATQRTTTDTRQVIDAYALWSFSPALQLRLSVSNFQPRDSVTTSVVTGPSTVQTATTSSPSTTAWALRLEMKL